MRERRRQRAAALAAHEVSATAWMVTFSDLLTLLLTFFVLRISMGVIDPESIHEFLHQERRSVSSRAQNISRDIAERLRLVLGEPEADPARPGVLTFPNDITLEEREDAAKLSLGGGTFVSGSRELSEEAQRVVRLIARAVVHEDVSVQIAGHTDDVPIQSAEFPSNWELSAARAITVANLMIEAGIDAAAISAVGYAETLPVASNETPEGRHLNRRVEVLLEPSGRLEGL